MEELRSPNGKLRIGFDLHDDGQDRDVFRRCPMWSVTYRNREVLLPSRLGLELGGIPSLLTHFEIVATERVDRDETWQMVCGEHASVRDHYAELILRLRETIEPRRELSLAFRAYDTVRRGAQIGRDCERPLLLRYRSGHWAVVGEPFQYDYPRMKLRVDPTRADTLATELSGNAWKETPFQSPWPTAFAAFSSTPVDMDIPWTRQPTRLP